MPGRLHLHLGAHKTATTHFQQVLAEMSGRSAPEYLVVPNHQFRTKVTHANRFLDSQHVPELRRYLESLLSVDSRTVLISEENLIGEAKDFIGPCAHYEKAEVRLRAFASLLPQKTEVSVWLLIRSLDSFLPAMYCEYLRHWPYAPFEDVLGGDYRQSWVPLIQTIRSILPDAAINVLNYDFYQELLPRMLTAMTGHTTDTSGIDARVVRPRLTDFAVKISERFPGRLPGTIRMRVLESASTASRSLGWSSGFAPFLRSEEEDLRMAFQDDLDQIRTMTKTSLFE